MASPSTEPATASVMRFAILALSFLSMLVVAAADAPCQSYSGVLPAPQLWSAVFGTAATITGPLYITTPLVYDLSSQHVVNGLFINATGSLYIQDLGAGHSASLTTDFISVQGLLQAGAAGCPVQSVFSFQMIGGAPMPYMMHATATPMLKAIVVWTGGSIELHGAKGLAAPSGSGVSWTRLEGNLAAGATVATLSDSVHTGSINDWQVGDRIIVGTTDYVSHTHFSLTSTCISVKYTSFNLCFTFSCHAFQTHTGSVPDRASRHHRLPIRQPNLLFSSSPLRPFRQLDIRQRPTRFHRPPNTQHHPHYHSRALVRNLRLRRLSRHTGYSHYDNGWIYSMSCRRIKYTIRWSR